MRGLFTSRILWEDNTYGSFSQDACNMDELQCLRLLRDYPMCSISTPHVYRWLALWSNQDPVIQRVGDLILKFPTQHEKVVNQLETNQDDLFMDSIHLARIYFDWKADIPASFIAKRTFFWDLLNKKRYNMPNEIPHCLSLVNGVKMTEMFPKALIMYQCWSVVPQDLRELLFCLCVKFCWADRTTPRTCRGVLSPSVLSGCVAMDYNVVHYRTMERATEAFWNYLQDRYTYSYGYYIPKSSKRLRSSMTNFLDQNTGRYNFRDHFRSWLSTSYPDIPIDTRCFTMRVTFVSFFIWARLLDSLGMIHLYNKEKGYFHFVRK